MTTDDVLSLTCDRADANAVLRVRGEIDETTRDLLVEAVAQELGDGRSVVVDMAGVTFIGSVGISALVQLHAQAGASGLTLGVTSPSPVVRRVMELVGLDAVLFVVAGETEC